MCKVRPEAFLWGAGTALGELPPYFMAKASRLSGIDDDEDEDLKAVVELKRKKEAGDDLTLFERLKLGMERVVERVGFFGILACASVSFFFFCLVHIPQYNLLLLIRIVSKNFCVDSESVVRFGWHNVRTFLGTILDILRRHIDWQSCDKNAHTKDLCHYCLQRIFD